jgi:hypothetical protein
MSRGDAESMNSAKIPRASLMQISQGDLSVSLLERGEGIFMISLSLSLSLSLSV